MSAKLTICFALVACLCHQVAMQQQWNSLTESTTSLIGVVTQASAGNASAANASSANLANQAPVTVLFAQILRGELLGSRKCKKPKDCGLGLRCDLLLNLCVPLNTPILSDIEKVCTNSSECSGMHACQGGLCRFCGPKSCRSNLDCCAGSFAEGGNPGHFFECLNIEDQEKLSLAKQLGRVPPNYQPMPKVAGGKSPEDAYELESNELIQLGLPQGGSPLKGKRCWARCNVDNDCYHSRTPADMRQAIGCCNNVCTSRSSCVRVSPATIQQHQQLQQQRLLQQQQWNQQQALAGQAKSVWGAGQQQQWQPQPQQQQQQAQQIQLQVVQVATQKPVPQSWQEAQQQGPSSWQQQG